MLSEKCKKWKNKVVFLPHSYDKKIAATSEK